MKIRNLGATLLVSLSLLLGAFGCSKSKSISVTDSRSGEVVVVRASECFKISGSPPTVTVLPLPPKVTGAVLSQYDSFVAKAMKDSSPNGRLLLSSLHESMSRGNLEGVAQKILYYEFFGEVLP